MFAPKAIQKVPYRTGYAQRDMFAALSVRGRGTLYQCSSIGERCFGCLKVKKSCPKGSAWSRNRLERSQFGSLFLVKEVYFLDLAIFLTRSLSFQGLVWFTLPQSTGALPVSDMWRRRGSNCLRAVAPRGSGMENSRI